MVVNITIGVLFLLVFVVQYFIIKEYLGLLKVFRSAELTTQTNLNTLDDKIGQEHERITQLYMRLDHLNLLNYDA